MSQDRAVNIAITHGLTLAITTVLLSGLLIGAGNVLQSQEQRAIQAQFDEIGGDVTAQINSLDRLNETGQAINVTVQPSYPRQVAGTRWSLELTDDSEVYDTDAVVLSSNSHDYTAEYPLNTTTAIAYGSPANDDRPVLSLCEGTIQFGECS